MKNRKIDFKIENVHTKKGDNAYTVINGVKYRVRVETLILDKNNYVYAQKKDKMNQYGVYYKIPGGSVEPNLSFIEQAHAEVEEEARINPKNIRDSGIVYIQSYNGNYPEWQKKVLWPLDCKCEGSVVMVFVAREGEKYTGYIKDEDKDSLYMYAKFYDARELDLRKSHKDAISWYLKNKF